MTWKPVTAYTAHCDGPTCTAVFDDPEFESTAWFGQSQRDEYATGGVQLVESGNYDVEADDSRWLLNVDFALCPTCRHAAEKERRLEEGRALELAEAQAAMSPLPGLDGGAR